MRLPVEQVILIGLHLHVLLVGICLLTTYSPQIFSLIQVHVSLRHLHRYMSLRLFLKQRRVFHEKFDVSIAHSKVLFHYVLSEDQVRMSWVARELQIVGQGPVSNGDRSRNAGPSFSEGGSAGSAGPDTSHWCVHLQWEPAKFNARGMYSERGFGVLFTSVEEGICCSLMMTWITCFCVLVLGNLDQRGGVHPPSTVWHAWSVYRSSSEKPQAWGHRHFKFTSSKLFSSNGAMSL